MFEGSGEKSEVPAGLLPNLGRAVARNYYLDLVCGLLPRRMPHFDFSDRMSTGCWRYLMRKSVPWEITSELRKRAGGKFGRYIHQMGGGSVMCWLRRCELPSGLDFVQLGVQHQRFTGYSTSGAPPRRIHVPLTLGQNNYMDLWERTAVCAPSISPPSIHSRTFCHPTTLQLIPPSSLDPLVLVRAISPPPC